MTHSYDHHPDISPRPKADRVRDWTFGVIVAVAAVVSAVHLTNQYRIAAPHRAAMAVAREQARAEREADQARRDALAEVARSRETEGLADARSSGMLNENDLTDEERRRVEEFYASRSNSGAVPITIPAPRERPTPREPTYEPARWYVRPVWPRVPSSAFPEGVSQISVRFHCRVSTSGALSGCVATETPAGTGLGDRMRPATAAARMEPVTVNGRPVASEATFSVSFSAPPRAQPTAPPPAPPAETPAPPKPPEPLPPELSGNPAG